MAALRDSTETLLHVSNLYYNDVQPHVAARAAYLAGCARLVGSLPFAQIRSGGAAAALAVGLLLGAAYAWRRWRPS